MNGHTTSVTSAPVPVSPGIWFSFWKPEDRSPVFELTVTALQLGATGLVSDVHTSNDGVGWAYVDSFGPDGIGRSLHSVFVAGQYWKVVLMAEPAGIVSVSLSTNSRASHLPREPLFVPKVPGILDPTWPSRWTALNPTLLSGSEIPSPQE